MKFSVKLCATVATFFVSIQPVAAQDRCTPVLQPSIVDLDIDTETKLALLETYETTANEDNKTGIGGKYGSYSFNYDSAKNVSNTMKRLLDINYSNSEKKSLYLSSLPPDVLSAYVECLRIDRGDISYSFSKSVLAPTFFLRLDWHPNFDVTGEQEANLQLTQGKFVESQTSTLKFKIADKRSRLVAIERDVFEPTEIAIDIDGRVVDPIGIPARSKKKLVMQMRKSTAFAYVARETRGDIGGDTCVELSNDEINASIIPGSFAIRYEDSQVAGPASLEPLPNKSPTKIDENERRACAHITVNFSSPFKSWANVKGNSEAAVLTTVPAEGYQPPTAR